MNEICCDSDIFTIYQNETGFVKRSKDVTLFDVYQGKQVAAGKKSMAFNIQFQSNDKTLTDADADQGFKQILEAVKKEFDAELRG